MFHLFKQFPSMPFLQKIVFVLSMAATAGALVFFTLDWANMVRHGDYIFVPCIGLEITLQGILELMRKQKGTGIFYLIIGAFILTVYILKMMRTVWMP